MAVLKRHHIYFLGLQVRICLGHLETLSDIDWCNSIRTIVGRNILIQWRCGNCYQLLFFQMSATQFGAIHTINNHRRREAIIKKKILFYRLWKFFTILLWWLPSSMGKTREKPLVKWLRWDIQLGHIGITSSFNS